MHPIGWIFWIGFAVTLLLAPLWIHRREGVPWSEALLLLMAWPIGLMWPLMLPGMLCDIIDGPYRPKHRYDYY